MKKNNLIILCVLGFIFSCKAQSQLDRLDNYTNEIVGNWVSEDDSSNKIEFTSNGVYKIYNEADLEGTFTYSLVTSCESNSNNGYDIYLKLIGNYKYGLILDSYTYR